MTADKSQHQAVDSRRFQQQRVIIHNFYPGCLSAVTETVNKNLRLLQVPGHSRHK